MSVSDLKSDFQAAVSQQQKVLPIDGVINFRDLGGYKTADGRRVKHGRVYRSGQLSQITETGVQQASSLGITSVMDLRFEDEIVRFPTVLRAFPKAEIVSWSECQPQSLVDSGVKQTVGKGSWRESLGSHDAEQVREAMRINYPQKLYSHQYIYKNMLKRLCVEDSPLVFHCAAGKDRTGVAAALILSLLGVSDEDIFDDYMVTAETTKGLLDSFHAAGAATAKGEQDFHTKLASFPKHVIQPVFEADPTYIQTLLDYVNSEYQGFRAYAAKHLEFAGDDIERLQNALLF